MKTTLKAAMLAAVLCSGAPAALAAELSSESRSVDARTVDLNLDGVICVKVKQGPVAALILYGKPEELKQVTVVQSGDQLRIDTGKRNTISFGNKRDLRAELTLPNLREVVSGGVGATEVNGFSGDTLRLTLQGAGAVKVNAQYRHVDVNLGGIGGMTVNAGNSDNVDLHLNGAGRIEMIGQTKQLNASLGGVGSLDAQQLRAQSVDVQLSGLGSASVYATTRANMTLSGLGSATVYGKPASRQSSAQGLGSVNWQ
ncbi:hypothetical protein ASF61_14035 [Duganella sp. Leaf126]|uniref:GIN domain-containing protein n=1 Tax=Duganella sp. Leaf126 TaxID=1736266 RepID=UPI0006F46ADE|nr:DUF2807 domain-containing protein [Duganella sp. Leaf126]KQQ32658.1 hypothetical protein ASF61_14035 [Duganella sp. Leaf126]